MVMICRQSKVMIIVGEANHREPGARAGFTPSVCSPGQAFLNSDVQSNLQPLTRLRAFVACGSRLPFHSFYEESLELQGLRQEPAGWINNQSTL